MQSNTHITDDLLKQIEEQFDAQVEFGYDDKPRQEYKNPRQDSKRIDKEARRQIKKERRQKRMFQDLLTD